LIDLLITPELGLKVRIPKIITAEFGNGSMSPNQSYATRDDERSRVVGLAVVGDDWRQSCLKFAV